MVESQLRSWAETFSSLPPVIADGVQIADGVYILQEIRIQGTGPFLRAGRPENDLMNELYSCFST